MPAARSARAGPAPYHSAARRSNRRRRQAQDRPAWSGRSPWRSPRRGPSGSPIAAASAPSCRAAARVSRAVERQEGAPGQASIASSGSSTSTMRPLGRAMSMIADARLLASDGNVKSAPGRETESHQRRGWRPQWRDAARLRRRAAEGRGEAGSDDGAAIRDPGDHRSLSALLYQGCHRSEARRNGAAQLPPSGVERSRIWQCASGATAR